MMICGATLLLKYIYKEVWNLPILLQTLVLVLLNMLKRNVTPQDKIWSRVQSGSPQ
jgi:hypothetical protein